MCKEFDYGGHSYDDEDPDILTTYLAILLILIFLIYGIFCLKTGIQE